MAERLTDRGIAAIKPAAGSFLLFDSEVSGLAVRVYPSGRKVFVFDWRDGGGRQRRLTIGRHPVWTIGKARTHAGRLRLLADTGDTVAPGRGERLADLIEGWRASVRLTRRPGTAAGYSRLIDAHILPDFGKAAPAGLTRDAIERWHGAIAQRTPVEANRALAVLSSFLTWLERQRKIAGNPAKGIRHRAENQRQVFLDASEIAAALAALDADSDRRAALALKLALLTGCRIGEAINPALAEQIDAKGVIWVKPAAATKQSRQHITPLSVAALAVAAELIGLGGGPPSYWECLLAWHRAKAAIGRPEVRIHDLRHSRASQLARNGASLMQIGRILGHTLPSTTQRYAHLVDVDLVDLVKRTS